VFHRGKILLERATTRWRGMWMLPSLEHDCLKQSSLDCKIYKSTFPFTHHRVTLVVHRCPVPKRIAVDQRWFKSIDDIAMPSPHRRAAQALLSAKQVTRPRRQRSSEW
jgi:hypothetical protein